MATKGVLTRVSFRTLSGWKKETVEENENGLSVAKGGLAQLARAPALHAGGQRFESVILHPKGRVGKRHPQ